ncbi:MAG TPA: CHAT domain-containing protein [Anaerolineae bacterium]|nr:CHAT domain-containing protein [Anaerolineae bacterium]
MSLPPELMRACREARLLVVWGDVPFALAERPPANRALAFERLPAAPALSIRLSDLPPLPILSLDASDRIERAFRQAGVALQVVRTRRDAPARDRHVLIKLAGDLAARAGVVLSRAEIRDLRGDDDKRYLLDEARRVADGGAALLVGCDPANEDFKAWWSMLAPVLECAAWFAVGEPSAPWPEGVACLEADFATIAGALREVAVTVREGGVEISGGQISVGGDVVGRDKIVIVGGERREAEPAPMDDAEAASLSRQLAEARENLRLIEERKSQFVMSTDVPLQLIKEERRLTERIADLKARMQGGGATAAQYSLSLPVTRGSVFAPPSAPPRIEALRLDAAVPDQVFLDVVFDLAVAVRQTTSPVLAEADLKRVDSGDVQVIWPETAAYIRLRVHVQAPDCDVEGRDSISFRLLPGQDSPVFYFHLVPRRIGDISLVVTTTQEDDWLGSARVHTTAVEQAVGRVQMTVTSKPIDTWSDLEIRILDRKGDAYPVEMTLNGQQVYRGALSAGILPWIPTGDLADDGRKLFDRLFTSGNLLKGWGVVQDRPSPWRIRLRIDAPELHALPWELLHDGEVMLSASGRMPLSRYLPIEKRWGEPIAARPIRVLAAISNPDDLESKYGLSRLEVELEAGTLGEALTPIGEVEIGIDFLHLESHVTLASIEKRLQRGAGYHILHFVGHGAFQRRTQQAALFLQDEDGHAAPVLDDVIAAMLARLRTPPHLVFLTACQSATRSTADAFRGLAPRLVEIGVPAVVAMQAAVTVSTARALNATFYARLLEHGQIDRAMNEARATLLTAGRPDVAVPVLFMRLPSGRLWPIAGQAGEEVPHDR